MDLDEYQTEALKTNRYPDGRDPKGRIGPLLGLAAESGSIMNASKKYFRGSHDYEQNKEYLKEELGDLLWYLAVVAKSQGLLLSEIASANLDRTASRYQQADETYVPEFDLNFPDTERFPRKLVFRFSDTDLEDGTRQASQFLVEASPNAFPKGRIATKSGKEIGFELGKQIGNSTTNNSHAEDGYRFHDAIHIAFLTVLGWSPNMRGLLRLKRKSSPEVDENEDGARAIFQEEGLVAILAQLAKRRLDFIERETVDGEVVDIVSVACQGLEVAACPPWLWRKAIHQGFTAMQELSANRGGYLICDLDQQELSYEQVYDDGMI